MELGHEYFIGQDNFRSVSLLLTLIHNKCIKFKKGNVVPELN
jgi:hypothetical protein